MSEETPTTCEADRWTRKRDCRMGNLNQNINIKQLNCRCTQAHQSFVCRRWRRRECKQNEKRKQIIYLFPNNSTGTTARRRPIDIHFRKYRLNNFPFGICSLYSLLLLPQLSSIGASHWLLAVLCSTTYDARRDSFLSIFFVSSAVCKIQHNGTGTTHKNKLKQK